MTWEQTAMAIGMFATIGTAGLGGGPVRAQDATPAPACMGTTPEENKELVRGYFTTVYNEQDPEAAEQFLSDEFMRNNFARPQQNEPGNDGDIQRAAENLQDFPDLHITVEELVAEGDMVVARLTWAGTHSDVFEQWNAPATGNATAFPLMAMYRVECGLLAEQWVVLDYLSMVRELGLVTDDELATIGSAAAGVPAATPQAP